jgi:hypothetical protein
MIVDIVVTPAVELVQFSVYMFPLQDTVHPEPTVGAPPSYVAVLEGIVGHVAGFPGDGVTVVV